MPDEKAACAISDIVKLSPIPVVADIHFDYKLALKCIENGISALRINPGNIGSKDRVIKVVEAAKKKNIPIRIGVNSGSVEKSLLAKYGKPNIAIIAKIENQEGVDKIDEIIDAADGIMVARGDLGVEVPAEIVPVIQTKIIKKCRIKGKPVITATQMLDSMQKRPVPTRAEVSDVANAIQEGTDCVMLSAESASGDYPVLATEMQAKISRTMEKYLDYEHLATEAYDTSSKTYSDAISNSVANTALLIEAKLIITMSGTGITPRKISKARPCCPIICISSSREVLLKLGMFWGIYGILVERVPKTIEEMEVLAIDKARELGIEHGNSIILTGATPAGVAVTNFMKIINVD